MSWASNPVLRDRFDITWEQRWVQHPVTVEHRWSFLNTNGNGSPVNEVFFNLLRNHKRLEERKEEKKRRQRQQKWEMSLLQARELCSAVSNPFSKVVGHQPGFALFAVSCSLGSFPQVQFAQQAHYLAWKVPEIGLGSVRSLKGQFTALLSWTLHTPRAAPPPQNLSFLGSHCSPASQWQCLRQILQVTSMTPVCSWPSHPTQEEILEAVSFCMIVFISASYQQ